jgi:hypothetical protein
LLQPTGSKRLFAVASNREHHQNWAAKDSDLDCLRDDPEFRKLVGLSEDPAP